MNNQTNLLNNSKAEAPITLSVIISDKYSSPCLELRRVITDLELIKTIVSCAFHERSIIIYPTFSDKFKSLGSLMEKGLMYRNKDDGQYYFNI